MRTLQTQGGAHLLRKTTRGELTSMFHTCLLHRCIVLAVNCARIRLEITGDGVVDTYPTEQRLFFSAFQPRDAQRRHVEWRKNCVEID